MPDPVTDPHVRAAQPLVLTGDDALLDDLQRLAAAADTELAVTREIAEVRRLWRSAPVVLVGADRAEALASVAPPRREHVIIVVPTADDGSRDVYRTAVAIGAQDVLVLPAAETWLAEWMAEATAPAAGDAVTIAVVGGRGGAGATVTAAGLAVTAAREGSPTLLVDADPLGGGIDLIAGLETCDGARWPDFADRRGRLSAVALRGALPSVDDLAVLSRKRGDTAPIPAPAMRAVLHAARRGADLVVVDLPRQVDDAVVEALAVADVTLLVVPSDVRGVAAAAAVAAVLTRHTGDLRVVARTGPGRISPETICSTLGLPLAGRVPEEPSLPAALDSGIPPALTGRGPVARFCRAFLSTTSISTRGAPLQTAA